MDIKQFDNIFNNLESSSFFKKSASDAERGISYEETIEELRKAGDNQPKRTANYIFKTTNKDKNGKVSVNEIKGLKAKEKGHEAFKWLDSDFKEMLRLPSFDSNKNFSFGNLFNAFDDFGSLDPFFSTSQVFKQLDRDMNSCIKGSDIKDNANKIKWDKSKQALPQQ